MLHMHSVESFFNQHFLQILFVHIFISFVLAYMLHFLLKKRFTNTKENAQKDMKEWMGIEDETVRGKLAKLLFRFSFHKYNTVHSIFMLFLLNFSMPLLGYISALWIALYLRNVEYKEQIQTTHILNLDEFEEIFNETKRVFGESALLDMMNNPYVPKSKKLQALASIAASLNPSNLKVVQETLKSKDDEIRMFGYAILNKTELSLNARINNALDQLKEIQQTTPIDEEELGVVKKHLGYLYWELIYFGFAQDILQKEFLVTIYNYIDDAEKIFYKLIMQLKKDIDQEEELAQQKDTVELRKLYGYFIECKVLKGKIAMKEGQPQAAVTEFTIAIEISENELDSDLSYVYPYVAEIYYDQQQFRATKTIMKKAQNLEYNTKLYPLVLQWSA